MEAIFGRHGGSGGPRKVELPVKLAVRKEDGDRP